MGKYVISSARPLVFSILSAVALSACGNNENIDQTFAAEPMLEPLSNADWNIGASAKFVGRNGEDAGHVVLIDSPNGGILLRVDIAGLSPGWHGMHLHQTGDCSDFAEGFMASGGHINPDNMEHGLLNPNGPDRGDLPNIFAGADGRATAEVFTHFVSLFPSESATAAGAHIVIDEDGFAVVVHANPDDHFTQPIGGAGPRVVCAAVNGS